MKFSGPLGKLLNDSEKMGLSEIAINGPEEVFVEKDGILTKVKMTLSADQVFQFVKEVADFNKAECDENHPLFDGLLPDGSRINIVHPPYVQGTPAISIRKYLHSHLSLEGQEDVFLLDPNWRAFINALIKSRMNIVVSGGTSAGKTTFLNMLLRQIDINDRLVIIEDTPEILCTHPNKVRMEASLLEGRKNSRVSFRDLVRNTMRMRPDRVIIGETRGGEFFDLLQAMNTGHDGSMTTIHANSSKECFQRMETLFLLSGFDVPKAAIQGQISEAIDFIFQLKRDKDGRRRVEEITEVTGIEGDVVSLNKIGQWDGKQFVGTKVVPKRIAEIHEKSGFPKDFFRNI